MDDKIIMDTTQPFYEQFKELGDLFEDDFISYELLKRFRNYFSRQCFYELKLVKKAENRNIKCAYLKVKADEKRAYKLAEKIAKRLKHNPTLIPAPLNAAVSPATAPTNTNPNVSPAP